MAKTGNILYHLVNIPGNAPKIYQYRCFQAKNCLEDSKNSIDKPETGLYNNGQFSTLPNQPIANKKSGTIGSSIYI